MKRYREFFWWNVIDEESHLWNTWDTWESCYYYYVEHRFFKSIKRIICTGYRPFDHPAYEIFKNKHIKS